MKSNGIVQPKLWWVSVPAIYGGFVGTLIAYNYNQDNYKWILREVQYRAINNNMTRDEELEGASTEYLIKYKDSYRRDRDLSALVGVGVYALNALEAYISGTFLRYDIQDDLAFRITPQIDYVRGIGNEPITGVKITMFIK